MAALTAARNTPQKGGEPLQLSVPIAASTTLFEGGMVMINSAGFGVPAASGTGNGPVVGVATRTYVNGGSAGAVLANVACEQAFLLDGASLTQASDDLIVYAGDDHTVNTTNTNSKVGTIIEFVSATSAWVYIGVPR